SIFLSTLSLPDALPIFPYSRSEWERMAADRSVMLLEALEDGLVLWDRGRFGRLRQEFHAWRASGLVRRFGAGWRIAPTPASQRSDRKSTRLNSSHGSIS